MPWWWFALSNNSLINVVTVDNLLIIVDNK